MRHLRGGEPRDFELAHLLLCALRDVADGMGDLADRLACLLGGRCHLLRRRRERAGDLRRLADERAVADCFAAASLRVRTEATIVSIAPPIATYGVISP